MKEKDKKYVKQAFELDESGFDQLVKSVLDKEEEERENFVRGLTENMPGRDAYEVKKILLTRLG